MFTITGKFDFFCLELGSPALEAPGLCPSCQPHSYATVFVIVWDA